MYVCRDALRAFLCDFIQDNAELFAEDVEKQVIEQREVRQRVLAAIPGMIPQVC